VSNGRMEDKWLIVKDFEGTSHDLTEVLFWHLFGGTEENHEDLRITGVLAKIQTTISWIQVWSITTRPACLIKAIGIKIILSSV
jgi:hypothetical protein